MNSSILYILRPVDALIAAFLVFLAVIFAFVAGSVFSWSILCATNLLLIGVIFVLASSSTDRANTLRRSTSLLRRIHDWYPVPMILLVFKEVYIVMHAMGRPDFDAELIAIDRFLFGGVDPTVWLAQHTTPILTEILQIAYFSYYLIMLAVGIELYARREHEKFCLVVFTIMYSFFLSYIGYMLVPGVGPRFTLHDFAAVDEELRGLLFAQPLRDFINNVESIPKGSANALMLAQRDVFPSGHTQTTLVSMYFAILYRLRVRVPVIVAGSLLIVSTVYLRYHYVIDLVAGAAFALITLWTAPKLLSLWQRIQRARTSPAAGFVPRAKQSVP
jgi:membrane-associated phospholipid phosphatase